MKFMAGPSAMRAVAVLEASKGLLAIVAGLGLIGLMHEGAGRAAESLVRHLHLNPAKGSPRVFLDAAWHLTNARLHLLALGAAGYAGVRFIEASGLWLERNWARLFGIASGLIYVPFEVWELVRDRKPLALLALVANVLIVGVLWLSHARDETPGGGI